MKIHKENSGYMQAKVLTLRTCPHEIPAISKFESTWYPPEFDTILCTYCY